MMMDSFGGACLVKIKLGKNCTQLIKQSQKALIPLSLNVQYQLFLHRTNHYHGSIQVNVTALKLFRATHSQKKKPHTHTPMANKVLRQVRELPNRSPAVP